MGLAVTPVSDEQHGPSAKINGYELVSRSYVETSHGGLYMLIIGRDARSPSWWLRCDWYGWNKARAGRWAVRAYKTKREALAGD